jgi:Zn-dependent protease with chaperone function
MSDDRDLDLDSNEADDDAELDAGLNPEEDERIDLSEIDPESWHPGIPWWPGLGLIAAVLALPAVSIWLSGVVAERLAAEAPNELGAIDLWRGLINGSLVAGAILILIVPIAVRLVRGRTNAILRLLEVGFPVGVVLVAVVVLLHSALAFAIVLGAEWLILGRVSPGSADIVALAGLASAVYVLGAGLSKLRPSTGDTVAVPIERFEAPGLFATIDDIAARVGIRPPDVVLVGPSMSFWSSNGTFCTLTDQVAGNVLHVSLPVMALLSKPQVESILAHELGHFRNGDMDVASRLAPAFDRIVESIRALDQESEGVGRIAAAPGRLWLDFAQRSIAVIVFERRRESESRADAIEAGVVGPELAASSLLAHVAVSSLEGDWASDVGKVVDDREGDPLAALTDRTREALSEVTGREVVEWTLGDDDPDHPAVLSRLRALGHVDVRLDVLTDPALPYLVADPERQASRLWNALRDADTRGQSMALNEPRVTPGVIGWVLTGIAFAVIFAVRGIGEGESLQIVVMITAIWLLFPIVYPYLQHEAELDQVGFRIRPWWYRWIDRSATRLPWKQIRWTDSMELKLQAESWATLSNGFDKTSWWAGIWPKRELGRLIDTLRDRGGGVEFSSMASVEDVERHAVVWYVRGRFLVPEVRLMPDGTLITVRPVKALGTGELKLSWALIDRLHEPVSPAQPSDVVAQPAHLADAAKVDLETFEREGRRAEIHRGREEWSVAIDGIDGEWTAPLKLDEGDLAEMLVEVLHLPTLEEAEARD